MRAVQAYRTSKQNMMGTVSYLRTLSYRIAILGKGSTEKTDAT